MKAKSFKKLDFIEIYDEKTQTSYYCLNCKDKDYNNCESWTEKDCKKYLRKNTPVKHNKQS